MSHSKRNTSRAVFTSHERALAKSNWSNNSARLNRDSFLPFGSCGLCLEIAREPVACQRGDVFCRECALTNILAQKRELRRVERTRQDAEIEVLQMRKLEGEEEKERAIKDFERTQAGLNDLDASIRGTYRAGHKEEEATPVAGKPDKSVALVLGTKRKFQLEQDELDRIERADKAKARKAIEDEKAAKPHLPSFWTPSLTPEVKDHVLRAAAKKPKTAPSCPSSSGDVPHPLLVHRLITIHFTEEAGGSSKDKERVCPSCRKALTNSSSSVIAQTCGHVLCLNCVKRFLIPADKPESKSDMPDIMCYVCDTPVRSTSGQGTNLSKDALPPGLVALRSEGTGFSAKGKNKIHRSDVTFAC